MAEMEHLTRYLEQVQQALACFVVGFVRVKRDSLEDRLLGSGTLISFKGRYLILTAAHVAKEMQEMRRVGVCVGLDAHRFTVATEHLNIVYVGWSGNTTEFGPDLALVELASAHVGVLKARKSFYELSYGNDSWRDIDYDAGIFLTGFVGEWTEDGPPEAGFCGTKLFPILCGAVGRADRYWQRGNFDFCSITVQCHRDNPRNYQGASGGSLWKVMATSADPSTNQVKDLMLCGVPYWQTLLTGGKREIICHGYRSVCVNVVAALA